MTSDAIQLPDAPRIRGLRFRHFRGGDDFRHMATITRASAEVDGTERADTPEELANYYAHLTNCDPYTDMIFAEVDPGDGSEPEVIGYSRGTWREESSGERRYMFVGRILPRWRRQGVGGAMLRWVEGRLREIAAGHPPEIERFGAPGRRHPGRPRSTQRRDGLVRHGGQRAGRPRDRHGQTACLRRAREQARRSQCHGPEQAVHQRRPPA